MELLALGYIGIRSAHLDDWSNYATGLLGMQPIDVTAGARAFRMDDRKQRLVISADDGDTIGFIGWEVADAAALGRLGAELEAAGVQVDNATRGLADQRRVADLIIFHDPAGNRLEAFHSAEIAREKFIPGRPISGFKTGPLGMGHVVLNVPDVEAMLPFYRDLLGFRVTDYGLTPYKLYFFHLNSRHHSFAMVGSGKNSFHHFMVELFSLDDVGQGYDLAQLEEGRVAYTLGRHTNDHMTSFYSNTPSGFFVEYGWGAREIDPATWQAHETFDGPSFWGHERLYMPEDQRARLRNMRLDAAARGIRAPLAVDCPWLDAVIANE
ncbi:VOC family protein [Sphingomonas sp. GB1N7]|uniref:VOC family protein n=1 Tax=Parasphingomonas caseinilytica TaxID=3096158 RepID=UPI002FC684BD